MKTRRALVAAVRMLLGSALLVAGLYKARNLEALAESISGYRLLPAAVAQCGAVILPWLEIVTGTLLILGLWVSAAAFLSAGMFAAFAAAVSAALARGLDIVCGCFGGAERSRVGFETLAVDLAGLGAAIFLTWASRPAAAPEGPALPARGRAAEVSRQGEVSPRTSGGAGA